MIACETPPAFYWIAEHEGFRAKGYFDSGGQWTIGYGSTRDLQGRLLPKSFHTITPDHARRLAHVSIDRACMVLRLHVRVPITASQQIALVSLIYNIGEPAFIKSRLLTFLNQRSYDRAALEFRRWVYQGSRKLPALQKRRAAEETLFRR